MSGKKDFYLSSYWLKIDRPTTQRGARNFLHKTFQNEYAFTKEIIDLGACRRNYGSGPRIKRYLTLIVIGHLV